MRIFMSQVFLKTQEPCKVNKIAKIFQQFPWLKISEVAQMMDIHKSVLLSYIYGMKELSEERIQKLRNALNFMGAKMLSA